MTARAAVDSLCTIGASRSPPSSKDITASIAITCRLVRTGPSLDIAIASYHQGQFSAMSRGKHEDTKVYASQVKGGPPSSANRRTVGSEPDGLSAGFSVYTGTTANLKPILHMLAATYIVRRLICPYAGLTTAEFNCRPQAFMGAMPCHPCH